MFKTLTIFVLAFGFTALAFLFGTAGAVTPAVVSLVAGVVSVLAAWYSMAEDVDQ